MAKSASGSRPQQQNRQSGRPSSRITQYRRPVNLNIGILIFMVILIYVVYSIIRYATARHVVGYVVRTGSISEGRVYEGLALRDETVVYSPYSGHINYFTREADRLGNGRLAYTVDESGQILDKLGAQSAGAPILTESDYRQLAGDIIDFTEGFDPSNFKKVYDFKYSLLGTVQNITNNSIFADISSIAGSSSSVHFCNTEDTGYIVYCVDGYEDKSFETLTASDFDSANYKKTILENNIMIGAGDPAYRLETAEDWALAIRVDSDETAKALLDEGVIKVRFLKNQVEAWAKVSAKTDDTGQNYILLSFTNSMITFCTDRFLDIELIVDETKGLKIPKTALIDDDFFLVPGDFITQGPGSAQGVLREVYNDKGDRSTEFVPLTPYHADKDQNYYFDREKLRSGDILLMTDSDRTYTVGRTDKLSGVYNINKGYANFCQVTVESENADYAIVKPDSVYGLREYDYIVLDATTINPNEFLYE